MAKFELNGKVVVVSGASRGIGLELVSQLLEKNNKVVATVRTLDSPGLKLLKAQHPASLNIQLLDVSSPESIKAWSEELLKKHKAVDVLINNAGIYEGRGDIDNVTPDLMLDHYVVNCMGPLFVVQALLKQKLLPPGSLIATITSLVASITENGSGGSYPYRCSKIAANMVAKNLSIDLAPRGITSCILHPGYVRTDMTGGNGLIDADESVRGMLAVLEGSQTLNGEWYHTTGRHLPW